MTLLDLQAVSTEIEEEEEARLKKMQQQIQDCKAAQKALLMRNQEKRRKASEVPSLLQKLKLKKKEIKLTRQKVEVLELDIQRYEAVFSELRAVIHNRF